MSGTKLINKALFNLRKPVRDLEAGVAAVVKQKGSNELLIKVLIDENRVLEGEKDKANNVIKNLKELLLIED